MRETRQSGSEGGARFYPLFLPLSIFSGLHRLGGGVKMHPRLVGHPVARHPVAACNWESAPIQVADARLA